MTLLPGGGAAIPVSVDTTRTVQGGTAIPVYGYTTAPTDGRPSLAGPALPVRVLTAADLKENGGQWTVEGRPYALPVYTAPATATVMGGPALAVYPVNAWSTVTPAVVPPSFLSAEVGTVNATTIAVTFSEDITAANYTTGVTIKKGGVGQTIVSGTRQANHAVVYYVIAAMAFPSDTVTWEYTGGGIASEATGTALATVTAQSVANNTVNWWAAGGAPAPVCAYDALTAANFTASKSNLANPGTYDLTATGGNPTWDATDGWGFNGSKYLSTGYVPAEGDTFLIQFSNASPSQFVCGAFSTRGFGIQPYENTGVQYWSGSNIIHTWNLVDGIVGVAGAQPYREGTVDGSPLAAWGGTITAGFDIGRLGGFGSNYFAGKVQRCAIWHSTLSPAQMLAVKQAIGSSILFFGDSITNGQGATSVANEYPSRVAAALYLRGIKQGIVSTVLQNTTSLTNNGRDTYPTRVLNSNPTYVVILYGLNDLRFNNVAYTVANFQNDLGEVVDALIAAGIPADNICLGSPPTIHTDHYGDNAPFNAGSIAKQQSYRDAVSAVATAKGTRYADVYQYMMDNGGNTLISADNVHPNDNGHAAIATAIAAAF